MIDWFQNSSVHIFAQSIFRKIAQILHIRCSCSVQCNNRAHRVVFSLPERLSAKLTQLFQMNHRGVVSMQKLKQKVFFLCAEVKQEVKPVISLFTPKPPSIPPSVHWSSTHTLTIKGFPLRLMSFLCLFCLWIQDNVTSCQMLYCEVDELFVLWLMNFCDEWISPK